MDAFPMLIDGNWVDSESREYIDVINPATEEVFARVPRATERCKQQKGLLRRGQACRPSPVPIIFGGPAIFWKSVKKNWAA
jgi:hypothetical protein